MKLFPLAVLAALAASAAAATMYDYPYTLVSVESPDYSKAVTAGKYAIQMMNKYASLRKKLLKEGYHDDDVYSYEDVEEAYYYGDDDYHYHKVSVRCLYGAVPYTYVYVVRIHKTTNKSMLVKVIDHDEEYNGYYDDEYSFGGMYTPHHSKKSSKNKDKYEEGDDDDEGYGKIFCRILKKNKVLATSMYGSYSDDKCKVKKIIKSESYDDNGYRYHRLNVYYMYNDQPYTNTMILCAPAGYEAPTSLMYMNSAGYIPGSYGYGGSRKLREANEYEQYDYRNKYHYEDYPYAHEHEIDDAYEKIAKFICKYGYLKKFVGSYYHDHDEYECEDHYEASVKYYYVGNYVYYYFTVTFNYYGKDYVIDVIAAGAVKAKLVQLKQIGYGNSYYALTEAYGLGIVGHGGRNDRKLAEGEDDPRSSYSYNYVPYKYYDDDYDGIRALKKALKVMRKNKVYLNKVLSSYNYYSGYCESEDDESYKITSVLYAKDYYTYWYYVSLKCGKYYYPVELVVYYKSKDDTKLLGVGIGKEVYYPYYY